MKIQQFNIRHWYRNRYTYEIDLCNFSPDILLLNETSCIENNIKLRGFKVYQKCVGLYSGVAILVRNNVSHFELPSFEPNTLAIKVLTEFGPLVVVTMYVPPRQTFIPTIGLNKYLSYNLPLLIVGDFNANHFMFDNIPSHGVSNRRGNHLANFCLMRSIRYLGPDFQTFDNGRNKGKPDLVLCNRLFRMFNYFIERGNNLDRDHYTVNVRVSVRPILIPVKEHYNLKTLNIDNFKRELSEDNLPELRNQPVAAIEEAVEFIFDRLRTVRNRNCNLTRIRPVSSYKITPQIKLKQRQLQVAINSRLTLGFPNNEIIDNYRRQLIDLVSLDKSTEWNKLVELAAECYGEPKLFWEKINRLRGSKFSQSSYLTEEVIESDSEDSDFGEQVDRTYIEAIDKAEYMSRVWRNVFRPNNEAVFNNPSTRLVENWFNTNQHLFLHKPLIDLDDLIEDHPILRPITEAELKFSIARTKNRAPGPSGLRSTLFRNLPQNYFNFVLLLFNSIVASKYWPSFFKISRMIFALKRGKPSNDPMSYRPISLLEILAKILERILSSRMLLYLEYHNFLPPNQFGFRPARSTQHSIHFAMETIRENRTQGKAVLVATRDISKAFDTVWLQGLLYKIQIKLSLDTDTVALIYNYVFNRLVIPSIDNVSGTSFCPLAGVPQGSCFGPILFLIQNHDKPMPIYRDTLTLCFADDEFHIVRSDQRSRNKGRNVIEKLTREFENTFDWEHRWRVKTNLNKCAVGYAGIARPTLERLGGVTINNVQVPISDNITLLGYSFSNRLLDSSHVNDILRRAKAQMFKLYRFRHAPVKVKKQLYGALVRSTLEYPFLNLRNTTKSNTLKLQRLQNKGVRFICGTRLRDAIRSSELHERIHYDAVNVRLAKLAKKMLYKMKETYDPDNDIKPFHKLIIDYEIPIEPLKRPKQEVCLRIKNHIFYEGYGRTPLIYSLPENPDDFPIPEPRYV